MKAKDARFFVTVVFFLSTSLLAAASPETIQRKVGIYIWGQMPDLISAASDAKRLGADQVTRIFIGPRWDPPPFEKDLRPLDEKMTRADYQAIFRSFQVIMITAYDLVSSQKQYLDLPPPGNRESREAAETDQFLRDVREEFRRFSFALSKMDRIFILSNWEAENDVPDANAWPGFARYLQARIDGVLAGRREARQQGYPGRVFTAFEFTIVPGFQGRPSGLVEIGSKLQGLDCAPSGLVGQVEGNS